MCCFCVHHRARVPTNVSEVHGSMILYSFLLRSHWILEGVTVSPLILRGHALDPGGGHCISSYIGGSLDPRTH